MDLNIKEIRQKMGVNQVKLSKLIGINRYSIWKAENDPESKNTIYVKEDKYFELHNLFPDVFPLPEDFLYFTKLSLMLNKCIYNVSATKLREYISVAKFYDRDSYMYDSKEQILPLFPQYFIPAVEKDEQWVFYENPCMPEFNKDIPLKIKFNAITKEEYLALNQDMSLFDKYLVPNIELNLACRNISKKEFAKSCHRSETLILKMLRRKQDSLVLDREIIDKLFEPYILPIPMPEK